MPLTAELISTGAELLSGRTINRHAALLGERLSALGIRLARDTTLPDDRRAIAAAVKEALPRADLIFTSGGLGPTHDDITREAICDALGLDMTESPEGIAWIEDRLRRAGRVLNPNARRQAFQIKGGILLPNPAGIAPAQKIDLPGGKMLFVLPGPPREFDAVLDIHILPWLRSHFPVLPVRARTFMFCGVGESDLHAFLEPRFAPDRMELSYCAAPGRVMVRLASETDPAALEELSASLQAHFSDFLYSEKDEGIADVVARLLLQSGQTVAVAESCTGGLLGGRLTEIPGSSAFFLGGIIAYANRVKTALLDIPETALAQQGAVSPEVARWMAENVRIRLGADYGLSITGVAGPGGGTEEKPVGLVWMGCAGPHGSRVLRGQYTGDRTSVRDNATQRTLWMLWRELIASCEKNPML